MSASAWTDAELEAIAATDMVSIATRRADGTLRAPVVIWVVRVGDALYVRAIRGRASAWYRGAVDQHRGRIEAGEIACDVGLRQAADNVAELDDAYRAKYEARYPDYAPPVFAPGAQEAALELIPER